MVAAALRFSRLFLPTAAVLASLLTQVAAEPSRTARVKSDRTNVRARPSYDGEVLATLSRGSTVKVIAEVEGAEGEPGGGRKWAQVQLPAEVAVWVYAPLVDGPAHQVKGEVLKFRAGPGRNYSELGELRRGDPITEIRQADDWIQIEPPARAFAFVAASLLETDEPVTSAMPPLEVVPAPVPASQSVPAIRLQPAFNRNPAPLPRAARPLEAVPTPEPAPVETPVPAEPAPAIPAPVAVAAEPAVGNAGAALESLAPVIEEKPAARAVVREGVVRRTGKLQAPGLFELRSVRRVGGLFNRDEGLLDFLIVENPEIKLERFENRRVFVHGTEWRDERWRTPVLNIERIDTAAY